MYIFASFPVLLINLPLYLIDVLSLYTVTIGQCFFFHFAIGGCPNIEDVPVMSSVNIHSHMLQHIHLPKSSNPLEQSILTFWPTRE